MLGLARRSLAVRSLPRLIARPAACLMSSAPSLGPTIGSPELHPYHIRDFKDLSGADLFRMSGSFEPSHRLGSSRERLAREIMIVDHVSHEYALEHDGQTPTESSEIVP